MPIADLIRVFYFGRLAARVFIHEPDGWMIKGGQALLVRYTNARLSQDIDLQSLDPDRDAEQALQALIAAAGKDLDDFLRFTPGKYVPHADGQRGGAQHFDVYVGIRKAEHIKVDVVVGRPLAGTPELRSLRPAVPMEWPDEWPTVRLYPVLDHIADKICAMYERHNGAPSNRFRDLPDLLLMSQQETIDGKTARAVLHNEAQRRRNLGTELQLPAQRFEIPDPSWTETAYRKAAALVIGLNGSRTLETATAAAHAFVTPLLTDETIGRWDPHLGQWLPPVA